MGESNSQFLGEAPIGSLMRKYAVPCIISLLVGALYNIVDQIFIANASYLGSYGNAANTVVFPLTVLYLAFMNQILSMFGQALNPIIRSDGSPKFAMAVVGIVMKFFQIVISIVVGMAAGCIPVVGFNMGAGKKDRVRSLFTRLLTAEAIVGAVALFIVEVLPKQLIGIFGAANESTYYTEFARKAFRIYLCIAAASFLRPGRCSVLHAAVGCADLCYCCDPYHEDVPRTEAGELWVTRG